MNLLVRWLFLFVTCGALLAEPVHPPNRPLIPTEITHIVIVVQENRTPDNLFHFLSPLCPIPAARNGLNACTPEVSTSCYDVSPCGLSNSAGQVLPVTLTPLPLAGSTDPNHSHRAFEQMCDPDAANGFTCRNDGAWLIQQSLAGETSYSYVDNPAVVNYDGSKGNLLDPYLSYAMQYGWANFMFQTNQGPSYPAHQFIFSGTSARTQVEDAASTFISDNFVPGGLAVGCLAPANATNILVSPVIGNVTKGCKAYDGRSVQACPVANTALNQPPGNPVGSFCDDKITMATLLEQRGISWKYYAPSAGSIWTAPNSIQNICVPEFTDPSNGSLACAGSEWANNVDLALKGADILNDITNCNLAGVSWVIPNGIWSDHASITEDYGPSWVAAIINAIGQNPRCTSGIDEGQTFWKNTAVIVTWDDWGGWSDNQPAPLESALPCLSANCQGDYQFGFRVPLLVVSAYTPERYIDDGVYDFGSILRTIEGIYDIPEGSMGVADARSRSDLSSFFAGALRPYAFVPALEPPSFFLKHKGAATPPDDDGDEE